MTPQKRAVAALSGLLMVLLCALGGAQAAQASDGGGSATTDGTRVTSFTNRQALTAGALARSSATSSAGPDTGILANLDSDPQITVRNTGARVAYSVISAPRGTQSPGWFDNWSASACPTGYACVFTPSVLNSTTQYWRVWKLYNYGIYDLHDFVYRDYSYVKNRQTGSAAFRGYEGGIIREQIFCISPSASYRAVNYFYAWSLGLTASAC